MAEPPKFSFGTPATSGASSGSLFGSAGAAKPSLFGSSTGNTPGSSGPSLFGGNTATSGEAKPSLFGGASTGGASGGFKFNTTPSSGAATGSLFGGASGAGAGSGFSFGKPADNSSTTPAQTPTTTMPAPSPLFGGVNPSSQSSAGGGLFGAGNNTGTTTPAANKASPLTFSTTPAGPPPTSGNSLFGGAKPAGDSTSLFGQKTDKPAASPFGQASTGTSSSGLFGAKPASGSNTPAPSSATGSLFSAGQPAQAQKSPSLFAKPDAPASASATTAAPASGLNFPSSTPASTPGKPLFGEMNAQKPADSNQSAKSSFSLGQPPASSSDTPSATPTAAPSLFGNLNKTPAPGAPSAGSPAPSLFGNLGQKKDDAPATASTTPSLFGNAAKKDSTPAAPAASGAATGGLFKLGQPAASAASSSSTPAPSATAAPSLFGQKPADSSNNTAAAPTGAAGGNGTTNGPTLGASTTGPAPPAASRLAAKSLDEILTLWTTSLAAHQKSFGNMATQISGWDRQLVENSDKISKLYARTFQAERDTAEVERQLTQVEGEQQELERYLDQYERQVDELIARNGGVEGGIDAERDRTYRIAERCSTRLTSMSHDLTSMIEEINSASANLRQSNKSANAQDPLTQIVKVLNGHLSQLQLIDQGASTLQQKVTAAQREARSLGRNGGLGNDEVDSFARSYLGRR